MQRIGEYEVVGHLASGGMAEVLLGRCRRDGQTIVLKRALSRDVMTAKRLRDEGRLGLRLGWSHFARTLELLEHEGEPVVALEWVDGVPLEALWKVARLSPWAVAKVGSEVASALAVLHGLTDSKGAPLGAVHRDLSSRNVLVESSGRARVIDLGCACFDDETRSARTETGNVLGTLRYLAPEVFESSAGGGQPSDLWSLGVLLLECALGRPLYKGTARDVAAAVHFKDPFAAADAQSLDARLEGVLRSLLQRDPAGRPSAARASEDLALLADELGADDQGLRRHVERARTAIAAGLVKVGTSRPSDGELAAAAAPTGDIVNPDPTINDATVRAGARGSEVETPTVPQGAKRTALSRGEVRVAPATAPTSSRAAPTIDVRAVRMTTVSDERPLPSSAAAATTIVRVAQPSMRPPDDDASVTGKMKAKPLLSLEVDTPARPMRRGPQGVIEDERVKLPSDASVGGVFRSPVKDTLDIEVVEEQAPIHRRVEEGLVPAYTVRVEDAAVVSSKPLPPPLPQDSKRGEPTLFVRLRQREEPQGTPSRLMTETEVLAAALMLAVLGVACLVVLLLLVGVVLQGD